MQVWWWKSTHLFKRPQKSVTYYIRLHVNLKMEWKSANWFVWCTLEIQWKSTHHDLLCREEKVSVPIAFDNGTKIAKSLSALCLFPVIYSCRWVGIHSLVLELAWFLYVYLESPGLCFHVQGKLNWLLLQPPFSPWPLAGVPNQNTNTCNLYNFTKSIKMMQMLMEKTCISHKIYRKS